MDHPLLAACEVLYVDHVAVTTSSLDITLMNYLSLPGASLVKGPGENPTQKVRFAFVRLLEGLTVEVLSPMADSPIAGHVHRGGGAFHLCFAVRDMKKSLMRALEEGAKLVSPPLPDTAFNGRCVAFLFYSPLGLFEFVEDLPATETSNSNILHEIPALGIPSARVCEDSGTYLGLDATGDLDRQLREVFRGVFPSLDEAAITSAAFNTTSEWDSLMHLQLICQVEMDFGVNIPSDVVGTLTSFEIMLEMLHNLLLKR